MRTGISLHSLHVWFLDYQISTVVHDLEPLFAFGPFPMALHPNLLHFHHQTYKLVWRYKLIPVQIVQGEIAIQQYHFDHLISYPLFLGTYY